MTSNAPVRTPRTVRYAAVSLAALAALVTGCSSGSGGPGIASVGSTGSPSGSAGSTQSAGPAAYSQCMRAHGIAKFPDPGPNGELQLRAGPGTGIDPESPQYKAADQACKALMPTHSAADAQKNYETLLKYAQCMRKHRITDFPDPTPNGGLAIKSTPGSDLDPNSPRFQDADKACRHYLPNGGKGGSLDSGSN